MRQDCDEVPIRPVVSNSPEEKDVRIFNWLWLEEVMNWWILSPVFKGLESIIDLVV